MENVYLLQHLHIHEDGDEDMKIIGIYSSRAQAMAAIERLKEKLGFCDHPALRSGAMEEEGSESGFYIDRYRLDEDGWDEGYTMVEE
jgi:hypothetical protein